MSNFQTECLSNVCEILMGQAPNGDSYNTLGMGYPLIAGAGDFGELNPEAKKYTNSPTKLSQPGDLILCIRATIGDRNWSDKVYCLGRGVAGLRAKNEQLSQAYLGHWIDHARPTLRAKGRGATFLQVSKGDIASLQIPLPPLAEQKRIAAILDAADAMRAKRREAIALLDTLLQSTFLEMFGDTVTNPMKTATLKVVAPAQSARLPYRPSDNVWQLNLDQIESQSGRILKKVIGLVSEAGSSTHFFDTGNVLYSKLRPYLNKVVCPEEPGIATTELVPLRPDPDHLDRQYLTYYLRSQRFVSWVSNEVAGAKMPRVTMKVFWEHPIPLPPLELQCRFAAIVESVEQQKALHRAHLAELDTLFASLQQCAFNGGLSK